MRRLPTGCALLTAFLLLAGSAPARCETSGPGELAPGEQSVRQLPRSERAARASLMKSLARMQLAELDSLSALVAASPADAGRLHREIEAAKRRHAREEIGLQRDLALRTGNLALVRKLETRLARLIFLEAGAR
jgi:hypothetical protein